MLSDGGGEFLQFGSRSDAQGSTKRRRNGAPRRRGRRWRRRLFPKMTTTASGDGHRRVPPRTRRATRGRIHDDFTATSRRLEGEFRTIQRKLHGDCRATTRRRRGTSTSDARKRINDKQFDKSSLASGHRSAAERTYLIFTSRRHRQDSKFDGDSTA